MNNVKLGQINAEEKQVKTKRFIIPSFHHSLTLSLKTKVRSWRCDGQKRF